MLKKKSGHIVHSQSIPYLQGECTTKSGETQVFLRKNTVEQEKNAKKPFREERFFTFQSKKPSRPSVPKVTYSTHMTTSTMVMMEYRALVFCVCLYLRI